MSTLFGGGAASSANPAQGDTKNDVPLKDPPSDSISDIAFSSAADFLAVSSWDNNVRIYEIDGSGQSQGKAMYKHEGPALSVAWTRVSHFRFTVEVSLVNVLIVRNQSRQWRSRQGSPNA